MKMITRTKYFSMSAGCDICGGQCPPYGSCTTPRTLLATKSAALRQIFLVVGLFISIITPGYAADWSGNITAQWRHFFNDSTNPLSAQHNDYASIAAEPEFYQAWDNKQQSLTITPFVRVDQHDDERTHGDLREFIWRISADDWQVKAGLGKVFWGVTESQHLVDVINQTDAVENPDGEDKLGQPMILTTFNRDWGSVDIYLLPYFRERTFTGIEGRPLALPVNTQQATYESDDKEKHLDYAVRIFLPLDIWEIGLSYFDGTSREPLYNFDVGSNTFIPHYLQMQQVGLAAQATTNDWLWKIEAIHRDWQIENFNAATAGFEYTFVGVFDSSADIGWVAEYLYDDRGSNATSFLEHDLMMGLRLTVNDEASTEALLGFIVDKDTHDTIVSLEAYRRIGNSWRLSIEARAFNNIASTSRLNAIRDDDYVQVEMGYYF